MYLTVLTFDQLSHRKNGSRHNSRLIGTDAFFGAGASQNRGADLRRRDPSILDN